ncbi:MAG: archaeosortase/exosortase family protein [Burkholderiaceae bacterium]
MPSELNARIGRTLPSPMFGVLVSEHDRTTEGVDAFVARWRAVRPVSLLLGAIVVSLWPHWLYMAHRTVDGSDEPWGILAFVTALVLVARHRAELAVPTRSALVASAALAVIAAIASLTLPDLAAAALAMLALGVFLAHALARRPATPVVALLLLALPIVASLQFYLGYPLRAFTAHATTVLLSLAGIEASANGAAIVHQGTTVLVDAPCAGIGMLWVGSYTAAVLSYLNRATAAGTALNATAAALLVLVANVARNTALFFPEAGLVRWPAWTHEAIGLGALALAIIPIVFITSRSPR